MKSPHNNFANCRPLADSKHISAADVQQVSEQLKVVGSQLGFNVLKIAPAVSPVGYHPLLEWIANGYDADMQWIRRRQEAYQHPDGVLPETRSVIMVALNYHNQSPPDAGPRISRYAWGTEDYHSVLRRMLKQLAKTVHQFCPDARSRAVVDTAPLLERDFARLAGIGWFGKNTMLISRDIGSWFFLGALLTTATLQYDDPFTTDHCGTCTRCLEACPTNAFPEPHVLDANKCISYLTIERRQALVPEDLRDGIGDWLFGCDICQEVCPWNRFAPASSQPEFQRRPELEQLDVLSLLTLDAATFEQTFSGTPLERTGRDVIVRNAVIVAVNQRRHDALPVLQALCDDASELVRETAAWAVVQLTPEAFSSTD